MDISGYAIIYVERFGICVEQSDVSEDQAHAEARIDVMRIMRNYGYKADAIESTIRKIRNNFVNGCYYE